MVNAWSLLYDELNGTMDENFPVKKTEPDDDIVISTGSTDSTNFVNFDLTDEINNVSIDTSNYAVDFDGLENDVIYAGDTLGSSGYDTLNISLPDDQPLSQNFLADNDDNAAHHFTKPPTPGIAKDCNRKYKEDESIKALSLIHI